MFVHSRRASRVFDPGIRRPGLKKESNLIQFDRYGGGMNMKLSDATKRSRLIRSYLERVILSRNFAISSWSNP